MLLQTLQKLYVLTDYSLNRAHIASVLCENRNATISDALSVSSLAFASACLGKCYLKKQLDKVDEQAGEPLENQKKKEERKKSDKVEIFYNSASETVDCRSITPLLVTRFGCTYVFVVISALTEVQVPPPNFFLV